MSFEKENRNFPEMPEQPAVPIVENRPCPFGSWYPSNQVQMMIIVPLLVLLLAVAAYCAYANWGGAEAFDQGFKWPWETSSGMKMPWQ